MGSSRSYDDLSRPREYSLDSGDTCSREASLGTFHRPPQACFVWRRLDTHHPIILVTLPMAREDADDLAYEKQGADVFMSGYLVKQGGNRKNWKKRFCLLTADSIRYYGKKKVHLTPALQPPASF